MAKTAKELIVEMDAEIAAKTAEAVELNKEQIDAYVEAKKVEAYDECVAKIKDAVASQYSVARSYLEQLIEKDSEEASPAPAATEPVVEQTTNTTEGSETVEAPVAPVEGPQTL